MSIKQLLCRMFFVSAAFFLTQVSYSQVTIGSAGEPNANALLDLRQDGATTRGLLLPRVNLESEILSLPMTDHVQGMTVFNLATSDDAVSAEDRVSPGVYYNDGTRWVRLRPESINWFYMPSISIDVSVENPAPIDLWQKYADQFQNIPAGNASPGAPTTFKNILQRGDIYYYVTGYDDTVFTIVSITEYGVLTYTVNLANVTEATFMNIVFVEKQ